MANNKYDEEFIRRFAYHFARAGSSPKCIEPLSNEFPSYTITANDLNNLKCRLRDKGSDAVFEEEKQKYLAEISDAQSLVKGCNIREGQAAINDSIDKLIYKLVTVNERLETYDPEEKMFLFYFNLQSRLMEQVAKYSGIDDVNAVLRAQALSLLKSGKSEEASNVITGSKTAVKSYEPKFLDSDDDDDDEAIEI